MKTHITECHSIEISKITVRKGNTKSIVINGENLRLEWLGDFLLIWSKENHPYKGD